MPHDKIRHASQRTKGRLNASNQAWRMGENGVSYYTIARTPKMNTVIYITQLAD